VAIDKRSTAQVPEVIAFPFGINLGVLANDVWIIDTNIVLRIATDQAGQFVERKTFPGMGTVFHMQGGFPWQRWGVYMGCAPNPKYLVSTKPYAAENE
jgi:hypothetical protein